MELSLVWMYLGFLLAAYSVVANDSIQTLGTFLSSNKAYFAWFKASLLKRKEFFYTQPGFDYQAF